ncbi:unnamed protein product [Agarophyton chilense]|eukprot:gb/GEZJ01002538.1/.p1 GENE.gb/GEZJ01002538.1/~~gb/GEZJ01002538.1/.p1  ORF type:complete len:399 (+),score=52.67 gb/GEZJ01002538.1/:4580-5776(+)
MRNLLSLKRSSGNDAENQSPTKVEDPGHPLFTITSTDPEERSQNIFRRMFSSNPSTKSVSNVPSLKKCSMVPPNYEALFSVINGNVLEPERHDHGHPLYICSLIDNAVRSELSDMYSILGNMDLRPLMLTKTDTDIFFNWFAVFHSVISEAFLLEEAVLFSWVEGADELSDEQLKWESRPHPIRGELSEGRRKKKHGEISAISSEIIRYASRFEGRPVMQSLPTLATHVRNLVTEFHAYFNLKKLELFPLISKRFSSRQVAGLEKKFWATIRKMEHPAYLISAMTSSMDRRGIRRIKNKFFPAHTRRLLQRWVGIYQENHKSLVSDFNERIVESYKEREKQVAENEYARAHAQVQEEVVEELASDSGMAENDSRAQSCVSTFHDSFSASHSRQMIAAV